MATFDFLNGATVLGFAVCSLFFIRFYHRTRDQLFLTFALAFGLMGVVPAILVLADIPTEERGSVYLIRLVAFLLIIVAIYRKNREA